MPAPWIHASTWTSVRYSSFIGGAIKTWQSLTCISTTSSPSTLSLICQLNVMFTEASNRQFLHSFTDSGEAQFRFFTTPTRPHAWQTRFSRICCSFHGLYDFLSPQRNRTWMTTGGCTRHSNMSSHHHLHL